jgi:murein DD-endopeptidase MepM/ murein hydrolase activator NlpD
MSAESCGVYGKRYPAVAGDCYYPVDIKTPVGAHEIALWDTDGKRHLGTLAVQARDFPEVAIELPPRLMQYVDVSPEDAKRAAGETAAVKKVLPGSKSPPMFTLPLHKPAKVLPKSEDDFGSKRLFNGKTHSLHSGRDFPVGMKNPVLAVADGTVVLVADHFYTGNAVYIDHGGGLVSMYFHLDSATVHEGDSVKRGERIGKIGGTGRATGPHLHVGLRWQSQRIDPLPLFDPPAKLPSVSDTSAEAEAKIQRAENKEPEETDPPPED